MKNYFNDWNLFEKSWLAVFTLVEIYLFYAWNDTVIGLVTMLTGIWCVILVAKGKHFNYYFGVVNAVLYAYISYQSKLYGEVMLNALYFLPMQFYGYYVWSKNLNKTGGVLVKMLTNPQRLLVVVVSSIAIFLYGTWLQKLGGNFPFVDSCSTVLSVIACLLMTFRFGEQWALWIFVNIASIVMWVGIYMQDSDGISMIVMWSAYLLNACYGLYNWYVIYKKQELCYGR